MKMKVIMLVTVTSVLAGLGPGSSSLFGQEAANISNPEYVQTKQKSDQYFRWIGDLRSNLDRSQIDLNAKVESLDFDDKEIVSFVTNEVRFEQYSGLLRGAEGTLRTMAGNALDQSVLLAKLLKDAGFDARINRSQLSKAQAIELLATMSPSKEDPSPYGNEKQFDTTLRSMWALSGENTDALDALEAGAGGAASKQLESYRDAVQTDSAFILAQLKQNGVVLGDDSLPDKIAEEARDYYWVEYRLEATGGWQAIHPVFQGGEIDLSAINVQQTFADSIPSELQHRFRFEVFVESKVGPKVSLIKIGGPWEYPVANLIHTPLTFSNIPLSFVGQLESGQLEIPKKTNETFVPIFGGAPFGDSFDLLGNVVPLDAAISNYAAVFATDAEKLGNAANALSSLGESDEKAPLMALMAQKIRITLVQPGGKEITYWRSVYDQHRDQATDNPTAAVYRALTQQYTIAVSAGQEHQAAVLDASFTGIETKQPMVEKVLAQAYKVDMAGSSGNTEGSSTSWVGMPFAQYIIDESILAGITHSYRHQPMVVAYRAELPLQKLASEHVDIIHSQSRFYDHSMNGTAKGVVSQVRNGVWASVSEGALLSNQYSTPITATTQFARYREAGLNIQVIGPDNQDMVADLGFKRDVQAAMNSDLERGYAVIAPRVSVKSELGAAFWWRVNPETGETLGVSESGEGATASEYTLTHKIIAGAMVGALAFVACEGLRNEVVNPAIPRTITHGDCVGLALGMGVGAASGTGVAVGIASWGGFALVVLVLAKLIDYAAPT